MRRLLTFALLVVLPTAASAVAPSRDAFVPGPVFTDFAPIALVKADVAIPADSHFKVVFNVSEAAKPGEISRALETPARFINQLVAAGVPLASIKVAIAVHGAASDDLLRPAVYAARNGGKANGTTAAIAAMIRKGVEIHLCGQSAAARGIVNADMLPGVKMSVSAMTSQAQFQQAGYTLNPF